MTAPCPRRLWMDKDGRTFPDHSGFDDPSYSADLTLYVRADLIAGDTTNNTQEGTTP